MRSHKTLTRLIATLTVALASLLIGTAAHGAATGGTFSWQDQLSASDVGLVPCYPTLAGTLTGTDTGNGRFVATSNGFHINAVETQNYRIDFANGWYLLSSSPTHSTINSDFANGQTVNTAAQQDRGTVYDAKGNLVGNLNVWAVNHLTWRDLNGNGQPDPGEITATLDLFKFGCP
jgi:hypothetical protein